MGSYRVGDILVRIWISGGATYRFKIARKNFFFSISPKLMDLLNLKFGTNIP